MPCCKGPLCIFYLINNRLNVNNLLNNRTSHVRERILEFSQACFTILTWMEHFVVLKIYREQNMFLIKIQLIE